MKICRVHELVNQALHTHLYIHTYIHLSRYTHVLLVTVFILNSILGSGGSSRLYVNLFVGVTSTMVVPAAGTVIRTIMVIVVVIQHFVVFVVVVFVLVR